MTIECPACNFSAAVDPTRIPAAGTNARCPRCDTAFRVTPDADSIPHLPFRFGHGRGEILSWAADGHLAVDKLPQALRLAEALPGPKEWRRFLDALALWLGAVFLAAAVIFFFAFNWQELGRYTRFGIVEALLLVAVLAAWRLGPERSAGKAALLAATLLVGALLALVGQTYQTGADPWELFATWAICVLPWVAIARFAPLWLLLVTLVNLAAGLYYHAFSGLFGIFFGIESLWATLAGINALALAAWEVAAIRGAAWLAGRWAPRLIASACLGFATLLAAWTIVDNDSSPMAALVGYPALLIGGYAVYRHRIRDLYVLAAGVLSLVVVVAVLLGDTLLDHGDAGAFLLVGLVVLTLAAAGGWWLRAVARKFER
jgi:predicted Zn finger-like uncharacterized protein